MTSRGSGAQPTREGPGALQVACYGRPMRSSRGACALLLLLAALPAAAEGDSPVPLQLDLPVTLAVTGTALAGSLATVIWKDRLAPSGCRICKPDAFDAKVQDALVWPHPGPASTASDVLQIAVPGLSAGALALSGLGTGGTRVAMGDLLITSEAMSVALLATQVVKYATGRIRPYAYHDPSAIQGRDAFTSFWSGHTVAAFAGATAAGQVARMRGYRHWPWILYLGLAGATACGYFRVAGDRHWTTDVIASAAVGSAAGLGLPALLHGPREEATGGFHVTILPTGLAGTF